MKKTPNSPTKSVRKRILVPLLGMSMAVSSYSTAWAEQPGQPPAPEIPAVQSGTPNQMEQPFFSYCYYWHGFWYCYYWYNGVIFYSYYCYYC